MRFQPAKFGIKRRTWEVKTGLNNYMAIRHVCTKKRAKFALHQFSQNAYFALKRLNRWREHALADRPSWRGQAFYYIKDWPSSHWLGQAARAFSCWLERVARAALANWGSRQEQCYWCPLHLYSSKGALWENQGSANFASLSFIHALKLFSTVLTAQDFSFHTSWNSWHSSSIRVQIFWT